MLMTTRFTAVRGQKRLLLKSQMNVSKRNHIVVTKRMLISASLWAPMKDVIATGGLDGLVKVWLFENNRLELLHSLAEHSMAVVSVAISLDGHTLASTSLDSTLIIWDLLSGQKVHEIQNTGTDVWKVAFSPDGGHIVTGSHTGKLGVYSIEKAMLECVLDTRGRFVLSVSWSPDGKYIASGSTDGAVCVFHAAPAHGKLLHTIQAHTQAVSSVTFSPDSSLLLSASADGAVHTYNVASGSVQSSMKLACRATAAAAGSDGRAAAAAADGAVLVAGAALQELHVFREHTGAVCGVQFNAEGNKLVSVSKDKSINIYECPPPPKSAKK